MIDNEQQICLHTVTTDIFSASVIRKYHNVLNDTHFLSKETHKLNGEFCVKVTDAFFYTYPNFAVSYLKSSVNIFRETLTGQNIMIILYAVLISCFLFL